MSRDQSFWARRRAGVEAEEAAAARRAAEAEQARAEADVQRRQAEISERPDAEILAEFNLPDPDSISLGDDIKGFLKREVPERLRRRALRSLWRSNPVLACVDGLNDYDGDFTNAATDAPGVRTAYQVGRGLTRHVEALAEEARRAAMEDEGHVTVGASATPPAEAAETPLETMPVEDAAPASTTKVAMSPAEIGEKTEPTEDMAAIPRRMRFRFETESG